MSGGEPYGSPSVRPEGIVGQVAVGIVREGMVWARGGGVQGSNARRLAGALSGAPDALLAAHCERALMTGLAVLADVERMDGHHAPDVARGGRLVPLLERLVAVDVPVPARHAAELSMLLATDLALHLMAGGRIEGDWGRLARSGGGLRILPLGDGDDESEPVVGRA